MKTKKTNNNRESFTNSLIKKQLKERLYFSANVRRYDETFFFNYNYNKTACKFYACKRFFIK